MGIYDGIHLICACGKQFKEKKSFFGHRASCKLYGELKESILTYDLLYDMLIINKFTANHTSILINEQTGMSFSASSIIQKAKQYNIKTLTASEACLNQITKDKHIKTNLERYGVKNT